MSDEKDDGGSAFPSGPMGDSITFEDGRTTHQVQAQSGMTLRDWFAGMMMSGTYASGRYTQTSDDEIASAAYAQADAMIEARKQ